jgi:hypothetical protein
VNAFVGTPQQGVLRESARALLAPELVRLGWDPAPGEDPETLALRPALVRRLTSLDARRRWPKHSRASHATRRGRSRCIRRIGQLADLKSRAASLGP